MRKPSQALVTAFVGGFVTALLAITGTLGVLLANETRTPETNPNLIAEQFGVTISWGDNLSCHGTQVSGCFREGTPDIIYVTKYLDEDVQRSVILHELGHVMQHRLGLPQDECQADAFAKSLGATWFVYECPIAAM